MFTIFGTVDIKHLLGKIDISGQNSEVTKGAGSDKLLIFFRLVTHL